VLVLLAGACTLELDHAVLPGPPALRLDPPALLLAVGEGAELDLLYRAEDGSEGEVAEASWSVDAPGPLAFDDAGRVRGLRPGLVTVTATAGGGASGGSCPQGCAPEQPAGAGGLAASAPVMVLAAPVTAIEIAPAELELALGHSAALAAAAALAPEGDAGTGAVADVTAAVAWSSSDPETVAVDGGRLRAIVAGAAVITARAGDLWSNEVVVTVAEGP